MKKRFIKTRINKVVAMSLIAPISLFSGLSMAGTFYENSPDLINMVDTSGSFQSTINSNSGLEYTYFDYSKAFIDASLSAASSADPSIDTSTSLFGLTGLGASDGTNTQAVALALGDNGSLFGTHDQYAAQYSLDSFTDKTHTISFYLGVEEVLSTGSSTYLSNFRDPSDNERAIFLFTDTNTETTTSSETITNANQLLTDNHIAVFAAVPVNFASADENEKILAVKRSTDGTLTGYFVKDGTVQHKAVQIEDVTSGDGNNDYIDTVLNRKNTDGTYIEGVAGSFEEMRTNDLDFARAFGMASTGQDVQIADYLEDPSQKQTSIVETTTETSLKAQMSSVMSVVTSHFKQLRTGSTGEFAVNNAIYAPASGISAGDGVSGLALWFTPTYSSSNNTQTTNTATHYEERNLSYLLGVDYVLNTKTVIGAMAGYEDSSADLKNGGDTEKDGLVFSVYGAYNWSNETTWYAQAGYGRPDNKIKSVSTSGTVTTGEFDSKKHFFGLGAMYTTQYNDFVVTLDGGLNWAKEDPKSYVDSSGRSINAETTKVRLLNLNYEIAKPYAWGEGFITAGLEYDSYNSSVSNSALAGDDQLGGKLGAGLRFNASDNLFGEVSANYNIMRKYQHGGHTLAATLRYSL